MLSEKEASPKTDFSIFPKASDYPHQEKAFIVAVLLWKTKTVAELQKRIVDCEKEQKRLKINEPDTIENRIAWNWYDGRKREAKEVLVLLGAKEAQK